MVVDGALPHESESPLWLLGEHHHHDSESTTSALRFVEKAIGCLSAVMCVVVLFMRYCWPLMRGARVPREMFDPYLIVLMLCSGVGGVAYLFPGPYTSPPESHVNASCTSQAFILPVTWLLAPSAVLCLAWNLCKYLSKVQATLGSRPAPPPSMRGTGTYQAPGGSSPELVPARDGGPPLPPVPAFRTHLPSLAVALAVCVSLTAVSVGVGKIGKAQGDWCWVDPKEKLLLSLTFYLPQLLLVLGIAVLCYKLSKLNLALLDTATTAKRASIVRERSSVATLATDSHGVVPTGSSGSQFGYSVWIPGAENLPPSASIACVCVWLYSVLCIVLGVFWVADHIYELSKADRPVGLRYVHAVLAPAQGLVYSVLAIASFIQETADDEATENASDYHAVRDSVVRAAAEVDYHSFAQQPGRETSAGRLSRGASLLSAGLSPHLGPVAHGLSRRSFSRLSSLMLPLPGERSVNALGSPPLSSRAPGDAASGAFLSANPEHHPSPGLSPLQRAASSASLRARLVPGSASVLSLPIDQAAAAEPLTDAEQLVVWELQMETLRVRILALRDRLGLAGALPAAKRTLAIFLYILIACYRGTLPMMEDIASKEYSDFLLNALRSVVASIFFVFFIGWMKLCLRNNWWPGLHPYFHEHQTYFLDRGFLLKMIGMCILNNQLPVNLIAFGNKYVSPDLLSAMLGAVPLFAFVLKVLMGKGSTMSMTGVLGLLGCCLGAIFVAIPQLTDASNKNPALGVVLGIIAPLSWAIAALYNKYVLVGYETKAICKAFHINWLGAIVMFIVACVADGTGMQKMVATARAEPTCLVVFLGLTLSANALMTFTLLDMVGPVMYSTIWSVIPIIDVGVEFISSVGGKAVPKPLGQIAGAFIVAASLGVALTAKSKPAPPPAVKKDPEVAALDTPEFAQTRASDGPNGTRSD